MTPGPRAPTRRPSRKTTARSYSRSTLSPLTRKMITTSSAAHPEPEPLDGRHLDRLAGVDDLVAVRRPVLAPYEHGARGRQATARDADRTDHPLGADHGRAPLRADDEHRDRQHEDGERSADAEDEAARHGDARVGRVEEEERAEQKRRDAARADEPEGGEERFGNEERHPEQEERQ